ncbi:tetratricopeptide repeat protein [Sphingomonas sp. KR1UV-12]|uniref:Tetratricopeptide repeat protein n=1 Tax=Sphingomonas aurea TaxID=3063994 RepID=A0ABT9EIT0_9SPHN|nr:tetratricopeptide repeat protein [Sphingomonas sp. KR1UV-12]MDP1026750.1 tetratricopeptide repeat protein [Sphingomonas sp. KR1UV-12]
MRSFLIPVILAGLASPAFAGDRTGYQAIATGDLRAAEATLNAERRIFPDRPELMLNLAAVYGRTGRVEAARALYTAVLERPDVSMLMPSGEAASSHALATRGLGQSASAVLATR